MIRNQTRNMTRYDIPHAIYHIGYVFHREWVTKMNVIELNFFSLVTVQLFKKEKYKEDEE